MTDETIAKPVDSRAARPSSSFTFSARDLVNVALFAVIYAVVVFAIAMIGVINPLVMLLTMPIAPVVAGVPYMLFLTRVRHAGMITLFGLVVGLIYFQMGHPWQSMAVTVVVAVLADLVMWAGKYRSKWAAIWAYVVFSAWFIGPWIPFLLDPVAYLTSPSMKGMSEEYIREFGQLITVPVIGGLSGVILIGGFLGALLGTMLLAKHFKKAGLA